MITDEMVERAVDVVMGEGIHDCGTETLTRVIRAALTAALAGERDAERLDYIERTFSGMTNRERYLPVQMIWGKGANGRTLREACDKYMARDTAIKENEHGK